MILIGLNGRKRSGKDEVFKTLRELEPDLTVKRAGFVDKMKLSGVRALGFRPESLEEAVEIADVIKEDGFVVTTFAAHKGEQPMPKTVSGRLFWQLYGTEAHRDVYGANFHVDALLPMTLKGVVPVATDSKLERHFDADVVCITDVRFPNEAQRILNLDGSVWCVEAEQRLGPLPPDAHVSEHPLPDELITDYVDNNGSLEELKREVESAWSGV